MKLFKHILWFSIAYFHICKARVISQSPITILASSNNFEPSRIQKLNSRDKPPLNSILGHQFLTLWKPRTPLPPVKAEDIYEDGVEAKITKLVRKKRFFWRPWRGKQDDKTQGTTTTTIATTTTSKAPEKESSWKSWFSKAASSVKKAYEKVEVAIDRGASKIKKELKSVGRKIKKGYNKMRLYFTRSDDKFALFANKVKDRVENGDEKALIFLKELGIEISYDNSGRASGSSVNEEAEPVEEVLKNHGIYFPGEKTATEEAKPTKDKVSTLSTPTTTSRTSKMFTDLASTKISVDISSAINDTSTEPTTKAFSSSFHPIIFPSFSRPPFSVFYKPTTESLIPRFLETIDSSIITSNSTISFRSTSASDIDSTVSEDIDVKSSRKTTYIKSSTVPLTVTTMPQNTSVKVATEVIFTPSSTSLKHSPTFQKTTLQEITKDTTPAEIVYSTVEPFKNEFLTKSTPVTYSSSRILTVLTSTETTNRHSTISTPKTSSEIISPFVTTHTAITSAVPTVTPTTDIMPTVTATESTTLKTTTTHSSTAKPRTSITPSLSTIFFTTTGIPTTAHITPSALTATTKSTFASTTTTPETSSSTTSATLSMTITRPAAAKSPTIFMSISTTTPPATSPPTTKATAMASSSLTTTKSTTANETNYTTIAPSVTPTSLTTNTSQTSASKFLTITTPSVTTPSITQFPTKVTSTSAATISEVTTTLPLTTSTTSQTTTTTKQTTSTTTTPSTTTTTTTTPSTTVTFTTSSTTPELPQLPTAAPKPTEPPPFPDIFNDDSVRDRLHNIFLQGDFSHDDLRSTFAFDPALYYDYEYD